MMKGTVIRNTGSAYVVALDQGGEATCRPKGKFRLKGIRTTNPVAVGDRVEVDPTGLYITAIAERRNYIIRRASNLSKESHILAANIDQAVLVVTLILPETSTVFIDRFLATAEAYRVPAVIVINKVDLLDGEELQQWLANVTSIYTTVGYRVIAVSAATGQGIDVLRSTLDGKTSLFSGNSGVGKSTLINRLIPGLELRTAEISAAHLTGMHTTTFSEMFQVPDLTPNTNIIDTPGVKGFGTIDFAATEVAHYFPEIFAASHNCRYGNCTHTHEPACAVRQALEQGRIAPSRYASYLSILTDLNPGKYRAAY